MAMQVSNLAVPVFWFLIEDMGIRRHARHEGSRALALVGVVVLDTYESSILACTKNVFKVYLSNDCGESPQVCIRYYQVW